MEVSRMASPNYLSFHHNVTIPFLVSTSMFISVDELFLKYFLMILRFFFFIRNGSLDVFLDSFNNSVYFFNSLLNGLKSISN
jgi:hypothetical protein